MMNTKTEYNCAENCMDSFAQTLREYLPEPNNAPQNYYETKSTLKEVEMPAEKIDVCRLYCMIYWGEDRNLLECKFCGTPRYKPRNPKRKLVAYKRMFYMPLSDRLKRLYES